MFLSASRRWLRGLRNRSAGRSRQSRLRLEILEDRCLPTTFTVVNTSDGGPGSLRQAILDANAAVNRGGADRIEFAVADSDAGFDSRTGVCTVQPLSPLPD